MATFTVTRADLVSEIRQRLLSNKSAGGTDPGVADDTAIIRRINFKHNWWASRFIQMGRTVGLTDTESFSLASGETTHTLPENFFTAYQLYRVGENGRNTPVIMIAPKDEHIYTSPLSARFDDTISSYKFRAFIVDNVLEFAQPADSTSALVGDYELKYYKYPEDLDEDTDEPFFPLQFLEIFVADVAASLASDGGDLARAAALQQYANQAVKQFWAAFVPPDSITNRRIKDSMGYSPRRNHQPWRI